MTILNQRPAEPIITRTDIGYTIVKQRFSSTSDYDIAKVGGWSRLATAPANAAIFSSADYEIDSRIFTWSGLTHNRDYVISLSFLDEFVLPSQSLIQAQYLQGETSLDLKHTNVTTKDPITITSITNEAADDVVANPFSDLVFTYTGVADTLVIQVRKEGETGAWATVYDGKPDPDMRVSVAGGRYNLRYFSIIGFSDGTTEEFPAKTYPEIVEVESGLGAPVGVSGVTLSSFKVAGSTASYDLRIGWSYPTDPLNQNKKRNFIVSMLPNPTATTDYPNMNWSSVAQEVALSSPYVIKPFPYKTAYVIRVGVMGWGIEASEYVYVPVFLSKDTNDSSKPGYLVPSDAEAPVTTKIQIDDEFIRAYSVFNPSNPSQNKLMFQVDAATGNVIIGRAGGAYNNTAITTAPFIFDSQNNKLQISGRVITDQIESASYVMTWIDGDTPSFRTAGKNGYASGTPGIWMGYTDPSTFKFDLGNATNFMRWDGSNLTISGTVRIGEDGRTLGQAQKQVFIYRRSSSGVPDTPTGGTYLAPAPAGWSTTVPTGSDALYMSSRLLTSDAQPPQEASWSTPSLFQPGSTGTATTYTWIKYADTITGGGLSDDPTGKDFIGIAVNKMSATESNNAEDYTWSRLTGTPGVPGTPGADGETFYTWIKYSPNSNGVPMTDAPDASTQFIGISPNRNSEVESTNALDYTWSRFKGDQGVPGVNNFKSTVFIRQNTQPATPTGGTYSSPIPTSGGWSDGIPSGDAILWASTRIFAADNSSPPHQASWTAPVSMTSTSELEIRYSSVVSNPSDPSTTPGNWSSAASETTVWMAQRTRTNGVWSAWAVSKVKGEQGLPGTPGQNGKVLTLSASTQTVTFNAQDVMVPSGQTVTFSVSRQNITNATVWSAVDDSGTVISITGSNTSASLDGALWSTRRSIRITVTADGLSDTISVARIKDGSDAVVAILTNEMHSVPATSAGVITSLAGSDGFMRVYRGSTDISSLCTFTVSASLNASGTISASGYYVLAALSADTGTLTLRAVPPSGSPIEKVFTVTKVRAGVIGRRGAGQYSAFFGSPGLPISSGMASAAKAACPEATPVTGDIVTLYNNDPNTKPISIIYNGTGDGSSSSNWDHFTVTIDGNLLVKGTVGADKINVNELFAQTATISGQLQVGGVAGGVIINGANSSIVASQSGSTIFSVSPSDGYIQGRMVADLPLSSLGQSARDWIIEQSNKGQTFEFGGSKSFNGGSLSSTTITLDAINFAAGPIALNFSYGGNFRTIISATRPTAGWITLQFRRNGVDLGSAITFNGSVDGLSTNEWYCTMPNINYAANPSVVQGSAAISVQISVVLPTGWTTPPLGAYTFGAFQEPSGSGVTNMNLDQLQDVVITSAQNNQVLTFENGNWVNKAPTGGGGGSGTLTDTVINSVNDQPLTLNKTGGSNWNYIGFTHIGTRRGYMGVDGSGNPIWGSDTGTIGIMGTLNNNGHAVLNASNFNDYSPTRTGAGASGTWPISITGTAALADSGVSANTYGNANAIPVLTVDSKGRITSASTVAVGNATALVASGTVVSVHSYGLNISAPETFARVYFNGQNWIAGSTNYVDINHNNQQIAEFSTSGVKLNRSAVISGALNVSGGAIVCTSTVTGTDCIATSDIRVKTDLKRIDNPIERLKKLNGGYTFNRTDMDNIRHAGVIANYVKEALPEAIFIGKDSDLLTVSHSGMLGLLVEVCTEQQKRIEELERRLNGHA